MPAIAPVPPETLKEVLERDGWSVMIEGKYNWHLGKNGQRVTIPKDGEVVDLTVMDSCLRRADMDLARLFELLEGVGFSYYEN